MSGTQAGARSSAGSLASNQAGGLAGSSIIVTGASQGIGKAVCLELAGRGARLTLAARDAAALEQVAAACRERGGEALVAPTDVSQPADCERLVRQAVAAWGPLDALINNAGIDMIARFDEVADLQLFERLMRVNYLGYVYPTYYALPELKRSRGRLVAVSSLAGMTGVPTRTGYAASKHAIFGFFDSLRIELAGTGVTVTLVAPDFVLSEIHRRAAGPDGRPLGHSPMQESSIMTAEQCARHIVKAMQKRQRLRILSLRGRLGRYVRLVAPGLIDAIAARAVRLGR
ncbi:MAG TPA: SDR family oxidoreductase [Thermoanaerobaculia bacterium]|nr:SDR family oxidoreductase [Thermoanaerobaculia bacterium]